MAVVITGVALALKLLLVPLVTSDAPFLLFFAAVMASAVFGGLAGGLLATLLAALCNLYFFMHPFGHFSLGGGDQQIRLALFMLEGTIISLICARLQSAREHAEQSEAEAHELERRILEISDEEQRRIGHDLHDGLGQHLTGIALMTRRLEQRLAASSSPHADDAAKVSQLAGQAVSWTHDLSRSLSPPALESAGLAEALRELAANAESLFGIQCTFEQIGELKLHDVSAADHLYRIAQEAISNAVRHGKAKVVRIRLEEAGDLLTVNVEDNGSGIDESKASADGMGLRIMRYRAGMIGATVDVRRRDAGGTVVTCRYEPSRASNAKL
jgi:signal transduction histidine kinase